MTLAQEIDGLAEGHGFAGVVSADRGGRVEFSGAYGLADRINEVPNTPGSSTSGSAPERGRGHSPRARSGSGAAPPPSA
jgi:hypothetical protein